MTHPAFEICMGYDLLIAALKMKEFWKLNRIQRNTKGAIRTVNHQGKTSRHLYKIILYTISSEICMFMICKHLRPKHNSFGSCDINSLLWVKEMCAGRLKCMGYELLIATIRSKQKKQPSLQM